MKNSTLTANASGHFEGVYGDPIEFKGPTIIAFLDLLGFSGRVVERWPNLSDHPVDLYKEILHFAEDSQHTSVTNPIPPVRTYMPHVRLMSDTILINVALPENDTERRHDFGVASWCVFSIVRNVLKTCLRLGFAIRGGIEHGDIYWDRRAMLGPALIHAYRIEQICDIGRVILGPRFIRNLPFKSDETGISRRQFYVTPDWVRQFYVTDDGLAALRPFEKHDKSIEAILDQLSRRYLAEPRIAAKYRDLISYSGAGIDKDIPTQSDIEECQAVILKKIDI